MRTKVKIPLDICMTVLFLLQMAYHLIGDTLHEWIGIALFALLSLHNIFDWKWYAGLKKGRYTPARILHLAVNGLLLISCLGMAVSAILLSPKLSALIHMNNAMLGRKLHMFFTSWSFVFVAAHIGLHWSMVTGTIKRRVKKHNVLCRVIVVITALLLSAYGLYAFIARGLPQRMFLRVGYILFDYEESLLSVLTDYIGILCLFACLTYYITNLIQICREKRKHTFGSQ